MCGIAGFAGLDLAPDDAAGLIARMTATLAHRGPDGCGHHSEPGVALGCRRLAIVDPPGGGQPMVGGSGEVVAVLNGEVFDHRELRRRLEGLGHRFRTRSDTEAAVRAYEQWGQDFLGELNGDFALALWDRRRRELLLARDRCGVHPLYLHETAAAGGRGILFASEIKALLCWSALPREVDLERLDQYLALRYVPGGNTLLTAVHNLPPGELLVFADGVVRCRRWWSLDRREEPPASFDAAARTLRSRLADSVRLRLDADVPVGLFLSGGVDSAALLALAAEAGAERLPTFSIGFGSDDAEPAAARRLAERFGTEHHEVRVAGRDFELLPEIVWHLDEPVGDAIVVPGYRLARAAAESVKVVLSGEGADEIFGGYIHHLALAGGGRLKRLLPRPALAAMAAMVERLPAPLADRLFPYPAALGSRGRSVVAGYLRQLAGSSLGEEYLALGSVFHREDKATLYTPELAAAAQPPAEMATLSAGDGDRLARLMRYDLGHWLPDYNLLRQDKLGLAWGLEVRVPYLDHRVVELAASLPAAWKIRGTTTKRVLRRAVAGLVPAATARAKKRAFYLPVARAFGPAFDDWARDLLGSRRARSRGWFAPGEPERRIAGARAGDLVAEKQLMTLVILELWLRSFIDGDGVAAAHREVACA